MNTKANTYKSIMEELKATLPIGSCMDGCACKQVDNQWFAVLRRSMGADSFIETLLVTDTQSMMERLISIYRRKER